MLVVAGTRHSFVPGVNTEAGAYSAHVHVAICSATVFRKIQDIPGNPKPAGIHLYNEGYRSGEKTLPAAALSSDIVHSFVIATVGCL